MVLPQAAEEEGEVVLLQAGEESAAEELEAVDLLTKQQREEALEAEVVHTSLPSQASSGKPWPASPLASRPAWLSPYQPSSRSSQAYLSHFPQSLRSHLPCCYFSRIEQ